MKKRDKARSNRDAEHQLLIALACHGLGEADEGLAALQAVSSFNRADPVATDLAGLLAHIEK